MKKKDIPCFEVFLNGKRLTNAKMISGLGVISQHVTWVRRKGEKTGSTFFNVGGLDTATGQGLDWVRHTPMQFGDELTIRMTKNEKVSRSRKRKPPKSTLAQKIRYFHQLKKELKGHI
jgi:hypothetical protein